MARLGGRFKRIFTWINKQPLSNRVYGSGGGADGQLPMGVTALQCQARHIRVAQRGIIILELTFLDALPRILFNYVIFIRCQRTEGEEHCVAPSTVCPLHTFPIRTVSLARFHTPLADASISVRNTTLK